MLRPRSSPPASAPLPSGIASATLLGLVVLLGLLLMGPAPAVSQPVEPRIDRLFLRQATDHPSTLALLSRAELEELGDPFFRLVLDGHADARDLDAIENLLQPDPSRRQTFVVSESILDARRPQARRAVLAYTGTTDGIPLDGNVMLSVPFSSEGFPARPAFIEAWGWDAFRGRYNYYKLDGSGLQEGLQLWKLRGSSDGADLLSAADRDGTCMACHTNGAPMMKELPFPWNNWHSGRFPVATLEPGSDWPAAGDPRLAPGRLQGAEVLETRHIAPAIVQFNGRRISAALERTDVEVVHRNEAGEVVRRLRPGDVALDPEGRARVMEGPRLLKHLFVTTEINMASAHEGSNLFPGTPFDRPSVGVRIPNTFFLDAHLVGGNRAVGLDGLGVLEALRFNQLALEGEIREPFVVTPDEYRELVEVAGQRLGASLEPADTAFAWFVPIASHMDGSMVERLMERGVVSRELVAAAAAVDLETPVFSEDRAALVAFVPETFRFRHPEPGDPAAGAAHPDELTGAVIAALEAAEPAAGSPAAVFLERLRADDPVELLRADVLAYRDRLAARLANPVTRPAELRRLFDLAHERRQEFLASDVFAPLSESAVLFPRR